MTGAGGGAAVVKAIADVRDTFAGLVVAAAALGVVVPCVPEGAGKEGAVLCSERAHGTLLPYAC